MCVAPTHVAASVKVLTVKLKLTVKTFHKTNINHNKCAGNNHNNNGKSNNGKNNKELVECFNNAASVTGRVKADEPTWQQTKAELIQQQRSSLEELLRVKHRAFIV